MARDWPARLARGDATEPRTSRRGLLRGVAVAGLGVGSIGLDGGGDEADPVATVEPPREPNSPERERPTVEERSVDPRTPVIGANLNGRPHRLLGQLELLEASNTTWVRAFLDVRAKLARGGDPRRDPDVVALRRAAREHDCRLAINLKWDFKANWGDKEPIRVPGPGSRYGRELRRRAVEYLSAIDEPLDVVVLGNEPMWETLREDVVGDDPAIVRFTRQAKADLLKHGDHGDPTYLVGAFNRAYDAHVRDEQFPDLLSGMTRLVREEDDVDGVDLHVHYDDLEEVEAMVAAAREAFPTETIVATEFSPVFRYQRNVGDPIDASPEGERFRREHGLPAGISAIEYFERAKREPRPPAELADFYEAMPWYNVDHLADVAAVFAEYGVSLGTFGFLQGVGMRNEDWRDGWMPFHINFLYQRALVSGEGGAEATVHPHYVDDYRRLAGRTRD